MSLIVTPLFCSNLKLSKHYTDNMGRDSSVGIATRYGLDDPAIESLGVRFWAPVQTSPRTHPASYTMGTGSFLRVNRPKCGIDHPAPSSAEVKERIKLYHCPPSRPSWPVLGWKLPLLFTFTLIKLNMVSSQISLQQSKSLYLPFSVFITYLRQKKLYTFSIYLSTGCYVNILSEKTSSRNSRMF